MYLSEYRLQILLSRQQDVMTALLLHSFTKRSAKRSGLSTIKGVNAVSLEVRTGLTKRARLVGAAVSLMLLMSCRSSEIAAPDTWKTYRNPRYNFEFPYPSHWVAEPPPDNQDGQAFQDPRNAEAEIRGWAGHQIKMAAQQKSKDLPLKPNFSTQQGLAGELKVNIGPEMSSMTLVLQQGDIRYHWQARSPSQQFDDYYRFFYYIARQYRIPPPQQP